MQDILLLGQIPGTTIRITFGAWLVIALGVSVVLAVLYDRTHERRLLMSGIYLSMLLQRRKTVKYFDQIAL